MVSFQTFSTHKCCRSRLSCCPVFSFATFTCIPASSVYDNKVYDNPMHSCKVAVLVLTWYGLREANEAWNKPTSEMKSATLLNSYIGARAQHGRLSDYQLLRQNGQRRMKGTCPGVRMYQILQLKSAQQASRISSRCLGFVKPLCHHPKGEGRSGSFEATLR